MQENIYIRKCVGCGYCCKEVQCFLSARIFGTQDQCPALVFDQTANRHFCKFALKDNDYAEMLYIGCGCCSPLNSDRQAYTQAGQMKG